MKVGDVVTVVEKNASGWYKGECSGAVGLFPSNYTELVVVAAMDDDVAKVKIEELKAKRVSRLQARYSAVETTPDTAASTIQRLVRSRSRAGSVSAPEIEKVRVLYAFKSTSDIHLALNAGDIVSVLEKHSSGWYKGECNGAVGVFPSNYTEPLVGGLVQSSGPGTIDCLCLIFSILCLTVPSSAVSAGMVVVQTTGAH